jgi:hypothetical protein
MCLGSSLVRSIGSRGRGSGTRGNVPGIEWGKEYRIKGQGAWHRGVRCMRLRGRLPGIKGWGLESRDELRDWSVDGNRDRRENRG